MAVQDKTHKLSVDDYQRFCQESGHTDRRYELVHGSVIQKVPTEEHGIIAGRIFGEIYIYLKQNPVARAGMEISYRTPDDPYNVRLPDISVTRLPAEQPVRQGAVPRMPDFAIEIKSPDQTLKGQREKASFYLENGCHLVWLVYTAKRLVEVYTLDDVQILTEGDILDSGVVLPDFALKVSDIFAGL